MEVRIACQGATTVALDELLDLQGNLKDLEQREYQKLHDSIVKFGFSFPIFIWVDSEGHKWTIDSHQRQRTLKKMRDEEGYTIPPLPADFIHADSKTQAKEKLLLLNSRFGKIQQEGFDEFIADIPFEDVADIISIDDVMIEGHVSSEDPADTAKEELLVTCPNCQHRFNPKA